MWKSLTFILFLGVVIAARAAQPVAVRVIVNTANPVSSLSRKEIASIFLKKKPRWTDGTAIVPVDQGDNPVREAFSSSIMGKSLGAIKAYWQQQIFSGRDTPPVENANDAAVVASVRSQTGAIGYVSEGVHASDVKVIAVSND